jgi:replicative DNA helicase
LRIPLIVASQVGKEVTKRDNKRAQMSDSLGSGAFERDADMWITLHRESYYQDVETPPDFEVAEIIIRKNRNGPVGKVNIGWQRRVVDFVDLAPEREAY